MCIDSWGLKPNLENIYYLEVYVKVVLEAIDKILACNVHDSPKYTYNKANAGQCRLRVYSSRIIYDFQFSSALILTLHL